MILEKQEAKKILDKVMEFSSSDEVLVKLEGGCENLSRFARNSITQNISRQNISLDVAVAIDGREAIATTTKFDEDSLRETVKRAEEIARLLPVNQEHLPPLQPQHFQEVNAYFQDTVAISPQEKAEIIKDIVKKAEQKELIASGTFTNGDDFVSIATSKGLFAYHRSTQCCFSLTARTREGDGAGRSFQTERSISRLNPQAVAKEAISTALESRHPQEIAPGDYTVILMPPAVMAFLWHFFLFMDARAADEGRSFMSAGKERGNKLGEKLFDEKVTIKTNHAHEKILGDPFFRGFGEWAPWVSMTGIGGGIFDLGVPSREIVWVEKGVVKNLIYSRYWAAKMNKEPICYPFSIIMEGEDREIDALISSTERGLLINNLWYIRTVDPNNLLHTGITRNGVFWIEDGKIKHPVKNMRFNESHLELLRNVEMLSRPQPVEFCLVPAIKANNFTFSMVSEAV